MTSGWEGPRSDTLHCAAFFFLLVFAVLTSFSSFLLLLFPNFFSPPSVLFSLLLFPFFSSPSIFPFPFHLFTFLVSLSLLRFPLLDFTMLPLSLLFLIQLSLVFLFSFLFLHFFSSSILSISFPCFLLTPFSSLLVCFPLFFSFYLISLPLLSMTSFLLFHPFFISCFLSSFSLLYCPFSFPCSLQFLPLSSSIPLLSPCFHLVSPLLAPLSPSACV